MACRLFPLEAMLRTHFLQQWFCLSDPATEDAFFDIPLYREFAQRGLLLRAGTAVDATLIAAPTSAKNKGRSHDPEMHSTKKDNQWYFGSDGDESEPGTAPIGVDADSGLVHTVRDTPGHQIDIAEGNSLLHDYMVMGERGMADMAEMEMPIPDNTARMMGGEGPFGSVEMGGMFSVVKVRKDQKPGDYKDPGWYKHPASEVAYEWTGALPNPARFLRPEALRR